MDIVMLVSDVCPTRIDELIGNRESPMNDPATNSIQLDQIGQIE